MPGSFLGAFEATEEPALGFFVVIIVDVGWTSIAECL